MSVQNALLALLAAEPAHGYELKARFEESSGGLWPLNVGQVYTTLQRLERDGLVAPDGQPDDDRGRQRFRATAAGVAALDNWFQTPLEQNGSGRDELALKVLLAAERGSAAALSVIDAQRGATMAHMQSLGAARAASDPQAELERAALLELFTLRAEADLRWLAAIEARLRAKGDDRP